MTNQLYVVKIGGNIIDDPDALHHFLELFSQIDAPAILVHGGGRLATALASELNIPQRMVKGRRVTDEATLKVATMVYTGWINKQIVAQLQALNIHAFGLSGADGNLVSAHKRLDSKIDYGFAGDVDEVNTDLLAQLLQMHLLPVIAPITHDGHGQLLNTNADTIAQEIAQAMADLYEVELIFGFEKAGVLRDEHDDTTCIKSLNKTLYKEMKASGVIHSGMIPKLENAFTALQKGVKSVRIGFAEQLDALIEGKTGTYISDGSTESQPSRRRSY